MLEKEGVVADINDDKIEEIIADEHSLVNLKEDATVKNDVEVTPKGNSQEVDDIIKSETPPKEKEDETPDLAQDNLDKVNNAIENFKKLVK